MENTIYNRENYVRVNNGEIHNWNDLQLKYILDGEDMSVERKTEFERDLANCQLNG